jgi:hypothetical protein
VKVDPADRVPGARRLARNGMLRGSGHRWVSCRLRGSIRCGGRALGGGHRGRCGWGRLRRELQACDRRRQGLAARPRRIGCAGDGQASE